MGSSHSSGVLLPEEKRRIINSSVANLLNTLPRMKITMDRLEIPPHNVLAFEQMSVAVI